MPAHKKTSLAAQVLYQKQFGGHSSHSEHLEIDLTADDDDDYSTSSEQTGLSIIAFDDLDDEAIPVMKEKITNAWNDVGNNFYHYGHGTSRSSVKAREKKERDKLVEAKKSRKITDFLIPPAVIVESSDEDDSLNEEVINIVINDDDGHITYDTLASVDVETESATARFSSYQIAFDYLSAQEGSVHRNVAKNKKLDMDLWNHTAALAICSYLQMMAGGRPKMEASIAY